ARRRRRCRRIYSADQGGPAVARRASTRYDRRDPSARCAPRPGNTGEAACLYAYAVFFAAFAGLFLKAAAAAGSFIGWLGRAFCRDRPSRLNRRPIEVGCIDLPNRLLATATRSSRVNAENPSFSGSGPAITTASSSACSSAVSSGGRPPFQRSQRPATPCSL